MEVDVPRDRAATFEPQIVKKRQRRLIGVDEVVLSLGQGAKFSDAIAWTEAKRLRLRSWQILG